MYSRHTKGNRYLQFTVYMSTVLDQINLCNINITQHFLISNYSTHSTTQIAPHFVAAIAGSKSESEGWREGGKRKVHKRDNRRSFVAGCNERERVHAAQSYSRED